VKRLLSFVGRPDTDSSICAGLLRTTSTKTTGSALPAKGLSSAIVLELSTLLMYHDLFADHSYSLIHRPTFKENASW
jgi:hypothetical protein